MANLIARPFPFSALPVVVPFSRENSIDGFIDLVEGRYLNLSHGNESEWIQVKVFYFIVSPLNYCYPECIS